MSKWTLGWWFTVPDGDGVVRLNNGREVIDGQTIPVDKGTRASGCLPLRASEHAMDALHYAPSPPGLIACRVRLSGVVSYDKDKASASHLTVLWRVPADALLRVCACDFAERALNRERASGREPDPRSWHAVEVARRFADGAGSVDELVTARNLAGLAADDAPNAAAANAAWSAARCASVDPAWAAGAAAWSAAKSAMDAVGADQQESTRMAAWDAEREWQIAHMDAVFLAAGEGDASADSSHPRRGRTAGGHNHRPTVELRFTEEVDIYGTYSYYLDILVDGESLCVHGTYGGEPEDNSRRRDYKWVEVALRRLAKKLGATVVVAEVPPEEEEEERTP